LPVIKVDLTAPIGKLQINTREIEQTDRILWKWFFREKAEITVTAADEVSGVAKIEYQSVNAPGGYQENGYWKKTWMIQTASPYRPMPAGPFTSKLPITPGTLPF